MGTTLPIGDTRDIMYDMRLETHALNEFRYTVAVVRRVNIEDRATREGCHALQHNFKWRRADLRRDGEEEFAPLSKLALNPHVTLHQRDQSL